MIRLVCRRGISLLKFLSALTVSRFARAWILLGNEGVSLGRRFHVQGGLDVSCTDEGKIEIGENFYASSGSSLICRGGRLIIGDNVLLGKGVNIVCQESVEIGSDCLIAEYVVIRDQDHLVDARLTRNAGFATSPVSVGNNVWIAAKASVLRGAVIGDGSVVGAHSLVRGVFASRVLVAGAPAAVIKRLDL